VTWNSRQDYSGVTVAPYTSAMGANAVDIQDAEEIIRAEYTEMPGLRLTFWQAQRLWNLSEERCERALNTLIATGFLVQNGDACYTRPTSPTTTPTSLLSAARLAVASSASRWALRHFDGGTFHSPRGLRRFDGGRRR
jgi:hypothetical protein